MLSKRRQAGSACDWFLNEFAEISGNFWHISLTLQPWYNILELAAYGVVLFFVFLKGVSLFAISF